MQMADWGLPPSYLILDHDTKFTDRFDAVFKADDCEVKRVGPMAPNMNPTPNTFARTPGPAQPQGVHAEHQPTWDEFVKRHASTRWVCDFLRGGVDEDFGAVDRSR